MRSACLLLQSLSSVVCSGICLRITKARDAHSQSLRWSAAAMLSIFDRNRTFRARRKIEPSNPRYEVYKKAQDVLKKTLGAGNLREAVKVPEGYDQNDWMSVNVVDLFNQINLLYGSMCEDCTDQNCPVMNAGPKYEYLWQDNETYKTATRLSAPKYIEHLMEWVDKQLNDESMFPTRPGSAMPSNFPTIVRTIIRRLFRVYAHIYHSHLDEISACGAEAHLSTCFKHFLYFASEFNLLPKKECEPLQDLVDAVLQPPANQSILAQAQAQPIGG